MGTTVNNMVNLARDWGQTIHPETNETQGLLKRFVAPRAAMAGAAVCDIAHIAKNIIHGTVQVPGVAAKWVVKPFSCISGSEAVKNFENRFPGISDFLKTVARIVAYTLGTGVAGTIGVIYPRAGIKFHDAMGLSYDKRAAVVLAETQKPCCQQAEGNAAPAAVEPAVNATEVPAAIVSEKEEAAEEAVVNLATPEEPVVESQATLEATEATVNPAVEKETTPATNAEDKVEIPASSVSEESTNYSLSSSEEEDDNVKVETPAAKGLTDYVWSIKSTVGNTTSSAYNWLTSSSAFKFFTADQA